jgi:hypothetical protein
MVGPIVADVAVSATVFTDPYCPWSWAAEPQLRRLQVEFGDQLAYTFVIVGLRRTFDPAAAQCLALACLDGSTQSGMPLDPRVWAAVSRHLPSSSRPASASRGSVLTRGGGSWATG